MGYLGKFIRHCNRKCIARNYDKFNVFYGGKCIVRIGLDGRPDRHALDTGLGAEWERRLRPLRRRGWPRLDGPVGTLARRTAAWRSAPALSRLVGRRGFRRSRRRFPGAAATARSFPIDRCPAIAG